MPLRRSIDALVTTCGAACMALGATVLVGAWAGIALLRRPLPFGVATAPETAACFVALGAALLLRRRGSTTALLVVLPGLLAAVRVVGYLREDRAGLHAGVIDLYPTHMAPNTALALLAAAVAIGVLPARRWRDAPTTVASVLGAQVLAISGTALLGYVVHLESAYGWGGRPPVAFSSAVALSLIAVALIAWTWSEAGRIREASWPAWSAASFGVAFTVFLWQALVTQDEAHVRSTLLVDAQAAAREIRSALNERSALVERAARRIRRVNGAGWDDEAALLRQSVDGLVGVGWRGPDGRLRWSGTARVEAGEIGAATPFSTARTGELVVSAPLVPGDPASGMAAAAFDLAAVFGNDLDVAPDSCLVVLHAGREVYRRPCAPPMEGQDFIAEADSTPGGSAWSARVWAGPQLLPQADSPLPDVVLAAGLTISGLLFAAIRLAQRAAARATEAEARVRSEAALRESEERYRRLFDLNPQGILVVDEETLGILGVNDAAVKEYGYSREEFGALSITDLWPAEAVPSYVDRFRSTRGVAAPLVRARHLRRDGTVFEAEVRVHPVVFKGRAARLGVVTDVTERLRAERVLRSSEERFRALVENSAEGIVIVDGAGCISYTSPATLRLLGWAPEDVVGRPGFDFGHGGDDRLMRNAMAEAVRRPGEPVPTRVRVRCRDGSFRLLDCAVTDRSQEPSVAGVVINYRDITDRQRAEEELNLRDRAIENISQGLVIIDALHPRRPIVHANRGFERITGYTAAEALGRDTRFLAGPETERATLRAIARGIRAGAPVAVDVLGYRKDGTTVWCHVALTPVATLDGPVTHFVGLATDITERRRLEEQYRQAQKMEAVGLLAGGIAHDFNNLLSVILGYSDVLLRRLAPTDPLRAKLDEISKAAERAASLTRQLLAFGRKQVLKPTLLDLGSVLGDTGPMLRRLIGEDVILDVDVEPELGIVKADRGQIEQVVVNLAVNARDAMPDGGRLSISCSDVRLAAPVPAVNGEVAPGDYVTLAVSDTGVGMDANTLSRVFEPFYTTKGPGQGTGLGLAMVYGIIEQSGGRISVRSALGQGTTFTLYLPRVDVPVEVAQPASRLTVPLPRGSETILLVEDEDSVRALAAELLSDLGYRVLEATNGQAALELAGRAAQRIDAVVTDVIMPAMNGLELAARLGSGLAGKVLYMSGHSEDAIARHGILAEGTTFIQKPFTPDALARAVRDLLDGRPAAT